MDYFENANNKISYMKMIMLEIEKDVKLAEKASLGDPKFSWGYGCKTTANKNAVQERLKELRRMALKLKKEL